MQDVQLERNFVVAVPFVDRAKIHVI